mgnify:CR=1 FL=1
MRYLIIIEETETGFSAYLPDLPGCVSTGESEDAVVANMREAIEFHIDGLKADDLPVPAPASRSSWVEVAA